MIDLIKELEPQARLLEPSADLFRTWREAILAYSDQFVAQLPSGKTYYEAGHTGEAVETYGISENPRPVEEVVAVIKENLMEAGLNPASGGHFGYIPGGGITPSALGDYLAAITNRYAGIFFGGPGSVRVEHLLIRWMAGLFGYPATATGNLTSGGSIANLIAITTARDAAGLSAKDYHRAVIYLTGQTHHCVQKALRLAGLREAQIRYIPLDAGYRMQPAALEAQIRSDRAAGLHPLLLVGSAGTTDTGIIDPLDRLADLAEEYGLWFHVDAAYGGFFLLVEELKPLFKGIERSDSVAVDPHKCLFLPYGSGAILIKDTRAVYEAHHYNASYLQDTDIFEDQLSPADVSPELTKHFRGLRMWLPLQLLGVAPFRAALAEKHWLCRYFYQRIQELGFTVGAEPTLSVCIFRYRPEKGDANAFNERLVAFIRRDGRVFLSTTTIEGVYWIRFAVLSFRSHLEEVELALGKLQEALKSVQQREQAPH